MVFGGHDLRFLLAASKKALLQGGVRELIQKYRLLSSGSPWQAVELLGVGSKVHIWSSPHTLFLANQLVESLNEMAIAAEVIDLNKARRSLDRANLDIVLAPAFFGFPFIGGPRIVFQLEQSTSTRWFTPEYLNYMNNSLAVFEYSKFNLDRLAQHGVDGAKIYYVPLGGSTKVFNQSIRSRANSLAREKKVTAYGDFTGSPRRAEFVKYASERMPSFVVRSEVFGNEMAMELESSDAVVHINYYSPSILATPRLWESLSRGCRVISEKALNWTEDSCLLELVHFVDVDEYDLIIDKAREQETIAAEGQDRLATIERSESRFRFMLARALFGVGAIDDEAFMRQIKIESHSPSYPIILSLPETPERHNTAVELLPGESIIFEGVKKSPGWIGCANSYKFMAKALLSRGVTMVAICEDDVALPEDYKAKISLIWEYLENIPNDWDVFVGLTADFSHLTKITDIQEYKGQRFIYSDKFTSTVFNIYSSRGLQKLANWENNPSLSVEQNTIDRAISSLPNLRVISLEKDIFGHDSSAHSTLWGTDNSVYDDMILRSSYIKAGIIKEYELAKLN